MLLLLASFFATCICTFLSVTHSFLVSSSTAHSASRALPPLSLCFPFARQSLPFIAPLLLVAIVYARSRFIAIGNHSIHAVRPICDSPTSHSCLQGKLRATSVEEGSGSNTARRNSKLAWCTQQRKKPLKRLRDWHK